MKNIIVSLLLFICQISYSQTINGKIENTKGKGISNVNVLLKKDSLNTSILKYTLSKEDGTYSINIDNASIDAVLLFKSYSYQEILISVEELRKEKTFSSLDIVLENSTEGLEEIFIRTKQKPISIKKDTITYNPESFKDNTEKVLEDLLKKLPGIEVKDNGQILFEGKPIESMLLDGDDLFEKNYTIGSKNMSIDHIEKVEAISNYNKNSLLASIKNSDAVALNLILKKGKTDFSNNTQASAGFENKIETKTNTLGISKKIKSFATGSYNNVGIEDTPYDFFSSNVIPFEAGGAKNPITPLRRLISNGNLYSELDSERARINNNLFGSVNTIYKPIDKLSITANFDFKKDRLKRNIKNSTNYNDDFEANDIFQNENLLVKPSVTNLKFRGKYKLSDSEIIESKSLIKLEDVNSRNNINLNNELQNTHTETTEKNYEQKLGFTKKLNSSSAIVTTFIANKSKLSQDLSLSPDLMSASNTNQIVTISKTQANLNSSYLKSGKNFNYVMGLNYDYKNSSLFSNFNDIDTNSTIYSNDFSFKQHLPTVFTDLYFKPKNWSYKLNLKAGYLEQQIIDNQTNLKTDRTQLFIAPRLKIIYFFNKISSLGITASYNQKPNNESRLFSNPIVISNRNLSVFAPNLKTLNSYYLIADYFYRDYFNITLFNIGLNYQNNLNGFITNYNFNNSNINTLTELLDVDTENISSHISFEKYVSIIKSNVRLNLNYSIGRYKNLINESELRNNNSYNGLINLTIKTGFLGKINFENNMQFSNTRFSTQDASSISNNTLRNSFKTYFRPKDKIMIFGGIDYYKPNFSNENSFMFFDTSIRITSKNDKIEYSINSRNATSKKSVYESRDLSDFYEATKSYNLVEPYLLFGLSFKL